MTLRLVFRPQAESELLEAPKWYEERRLDLGQAFAAAIVARIAGIISSPLAAPRVRGEMRRSVLKRFPYAIYYQVLPDEVVVLAVMHGRRHPRRWESRS
jgi:plasmid stabilization system protein ParE